MELLRVLKGTTKGSRVPQRVLGFSGTLFEGSIARVPYTGQRRTLLAPFFLRVYVLMFLYMSNHFVISYCVTFTRAHTLTL